MGERKQKFTFSGFSSPNTTPVPDELFDQLLTVLSGNELKVVLYVIRRTFGFKKDSDNISLSQMLNGITRKDGTRLDSGAGLSKPTLLRALRDLTAAEVIIAERRESKQRGYESTNYRLNVLTPLGKNLSQGMYQDFTKPLVNKRAIQETVLQDTEYNVNVGLIKNGGKKAANDNDVSDSDAGLLYEIIEYTGDTNPKSKGTFRRVISGLGQGTAQQILTITKEAVRSGKCPKHRSAAYFVATANNIAEEQGIDLGFKNGAQKNRFAIANLKAEIGNIGTVRSLKSNRDDAE